MKQKEEQQEYEEEIMRLTVELEHYITGGVNESQIEYVEYAK